MTRFCTTPWTHMTIGPNNVIPCCYVDQTPFDKMTVNEYLESDALENLKQQFLSGIEPKECNRCWVSEAASGESLRTLQNKQVGYNEIVLDPSILTDGLQHLDLSTGSSCNLACRTCKPTQSSHWVKVTNNLIAQGNDLPTPQKCAIHYFKSKEYTDTIKRISKNLTSINILGGEPFLGQAKEHVDILQALDSDKLESLAYITNGTIFPDERILAEWPRFKKITINFSIDGIEDIFEYTRCPAKWDTLLEVMNRICIKHYAPSKVCRMGSNYKSDRCDIPTCILANTLCNAFITA